ncbi:hypothetical protein D9M68_876330 [compost metagenome]
MAMAHQPQSDLVRDSVAALVPIETKNESASQNEAIGRVPCDVHHPAAYWNSMLVSLNIIAKANSGVEKCGYAAHPLCGIDVRGTEVCSWA